MLVYFTFYFFLVHLSILSSYGNSFGTFVYVIIFCVGGGRSPFMSVFDGLDL